MNCYLINVPGESESKPSVEGTALKANQLEGRLLSLPGVLSAAVNALTAAFW